jgi:serine/threonine-protein kinase RsbT
MRVVRTDTMPVRSPADIVSVRTSVRRWSQELNFSLVDQTKMVTAASELARNTMDHGGGGEVRFEQLEDGLRRGLRLTFEDRGQGISDVNLAMQDGYTTGGGLGMGLPGARRLVNEFALHSAPGQGTRVTITRWK